MNLIWVCRIRVGDEELVGGEGHLVQTKLFPLPLDPGSQPSGDKTRLVLRNFFQLATTRGSLDTGSSGIYE
jgi:hypothetical protein